MKLFMSFYVHRYWFRLRCVLEFLPNVYKLIKNKEIGSYRQFYIVNPILYGWDTVPRKEYHEYQKGRILTNREGIQIQYKFKPKS